MREIKIRAPAGLGQTIAQLALDRGARSVIIMSAYDAVAGEAVEEIKVKTATSKARFVCEALEQSALSQEGRISFSSHDVRSIVSKEDIASLTRPFCMPHDDVYQDLWQTTH